MTPARAPLALELLFACTIFASAFLLFLVQPLVSKQILPWFGGSAAVWATCMVFFQVVLLAGYAYADALARWLRPRRQAVLHASLLGLSLWWLPIAPDAAWQPQGDEDPGLRILGLLLATIGLPYFLLATTGPLVQTWVAASLPSARVYRYFSLSNGASLVALMAYPFVVEPHATLALQAAGWSIVYALFALLCAASAWQFVRNATSAPAAATRGPAPPAALQLLWLALAAMGSWLLLAVTNHITQNVAAVPLLWLLPLTLYLLTFVLAFESDRWYRRALIAPAAAALMALCAYDLQGGAGLPSDLRFTVALYTVGLFLACLFVHGELAGLRPAPRHLTRFYLMLALGGALGGIAVGLGAPRLLPAYYELGLGYTLVALLGVLVLRGRRRWAVGAGLLALWCAVSLVRQVQSDHDGARVLARNFYGTLLTADRQRDDRRDDVRRLLHGAVIHGEQYLASDRRAEPTTYYGPSAGIGLALQAAPGGARKIGLVGLGVGTLAAYGRAGDVVWVYEIDPQVFLIADAEFSFLRNSAARIERVLGDARLALEREPAQGFDVLAVDAFSGGAIPVHLLTREALAVYRRHLKPGGVVAFHVTNRHLALAPVVGQIATALGMHAVLVHDDAEGLPLRRTDWVLVSDDAAALAQPVIARAATAIAVPPGLRLWSDDFNNLWQVLR